MIELRVDVGGAPSNVEVNATWLDDRGRVLGSETHRSRAGQQTMVFAAPAPGGLKPGHYRAQVRVAGQLIREQPFDVKPPADPGQPDEKLQTAVPHQEPAAEC